MLVIYCIQLYSEWDKARFLKWACGIGEATNQGIQGLFDSYRTEEQAYKGCLFLLKLADKYTPERLERACKATLERIPSPRYKNIRLILESGNDKTAAYYLFYRFGYFVFVTAPFPLT